MDLVIIKSTLMRYSAPIFSAIFALFFWIGAFPGWMSGDSYTQWVEASGQFLISDMHSAQLSKAWSLLFPNELGPIIPFSLQVLSYFVGLFLFLKWVASRSVGISWIAALLAIMMPFTWTVAWIWKDAYLISLTSLSTGLFLAASTCRNQLWKITFFFCSAFTLGLASIGRIYMFPALLFWACSLCFLIYGFQKIWIKISSFILISAIPFAGLGAIWPTLNKPFASYHSASTQLLDLARLECRSRNVEKTTPITGLIPRQLIVNPDVADICSQYNPYFWDDIVWTSPEEVHVRVPASDAEAAALFDEWKGAITARPNAILAAKIEAFNQLLSISDFPEVPHHDAQPYNYGGLGLSLDNERPYGGFFPSRGGAILAFVATPADLVVSTSPQVLSGLIWILIIPIALLFVGVGLFKSLRTNRYLPILSSGLIWGIFATLVSPAIVTRYLGVGVMMNFFAAVLLITIFITSRKSAQK